MAIIDLVKNEGDGRLLAWQYPHMQSAAYIQLVVGEGEVALLLRDRRLHRLYRTGRYFVATGSLPVLDALVSLPYGGKQAAEVQVWFVRTTELPGIRWGTQQPVKLTGGDGEQLSLCGYGQLDVRVEDPQIFLTTLCRNLTKYGEREVTSLLRLNVLQALRDCAAQLLRERAGLPGLEGALGELSARTRAVLQPQMERFGMSVTGFVVAGLEQDEQVGIARATGFCSGCGAPLRELWRYCPFCGAAPDGRSMK